MSRLIDADALKKSVEGLMDCYNGFSDTYDKACIIGLIDEEPSVDAVKVKHGHWIKIGSQYSIRNMKCSICGEEVFGDVDTEKYCFNCGSKMDEVTE